MYTGQVIAGGQVLVQPDGTVVSAPVAIEHSHPLQQPPQFVDAQVMFPGQTPQPAAPQPQTPAAAFQVTPLSLLTASNSQ